MPPTWLVPYVRLSIAGNNNLVQVVKPQSKPSQMKQKSLLRFSFFHFLLHPSVTVGNVI